MNEKKKSEAADCFTKLDLNICYLKLKLNKHLEKIQFSLQMTQLFKFRDKDLHSSKKSEYSVRQHPNLWVTYASCHKIKNSMHY